MPRKQATPKRKVTIVIDDTIMERIAALQAKLDYITIAGVFQNGARLELDRLDKLLSEKE